MGVYVYMYICTYIYSVLVYIYVYAPHACSTNRGQKRAPDNIKTRVTAGSCEQWVINY